MAQDVNLGGALRRRLNLARRKALGAARRRGGLVCIRIERRLRRAGGFGRIRWRAFEIRFDRLLAGLAFGRDIVWRRRGFGLERFGQRRDALLFIRVGETSGVSASRLSVGWNERSNSIGPAAASPGPVCISRARASGAASGSNPSISAGRSPSGGAGEKSASGAATASNS